MPVSLASTDYLAAIDAATLRIQSAVRAVGTTAEVPTCPEWTIAELVAHLGMVHRWARAQIVGGDAPYASESDVLAEVAAADLHDWLGDGSAALIESLRSAPADVDAWVFMETGRTPLEFWTRRQAHETTMHAVDAVAAQVGSIRSASEATDGIDLSADFAVDGLDELLVRFAPRGRSKLFAGTPISVVVDPTDADAVWTLSVTEEALTVTDGDTATPDSRWSGAAAQLYLGLWNRGDEIVVDGDPTPLEHWRARQRIR